MHQCFPVTFQRYCSGFHTGEATFSDACELLLYHYPFSIPFTASGVTRLVDISFYSILPLLIQLLEKIQGGDFLCVFPLQVKRKKEKSFSSAYLGLPQGRILSASYFWKFSWKIDWTKNKSQHFNLSHSPLPLWKPREKHWFWSSRGTLLLAIN